MFKKIKKLKQQKEANKELYSHYKELFEVSVSELKFYKMRIENLKNIIEEIETITDDNLTKKLCKIGIERDNIDTIIHNKTICYNQNNGSLIE